MAKILKPGNKNHDKPWVGKKLNCTNCKCRFQLDAKDEVLETNNQRDGHYYSYNCPCCRSLVTFYPEHKPIPYDSDNR